MPDKKPPGNEELLPKHEPQHTHPCKDCAFRRDIRPNIEDPEGAQNNGCSPLGGSPAEVYIGQTLLSFRVPCHMRHDSTDLEARLDNANPDCAGIAVLRSNVGVADSIAPQLLHLPADRETVFADIYEFYAHHKGISVEAAKKVLDPKTIDYLKQAAFAIAQVKMLAGRAKVEKFQRKGS